MPIATSSDKIDISSEKKLEEIAKIIQKKIKVGNIIFLHGEMGIGKTTFVKYLINYYQKINELNLSEVTSPTFNIMNEYLVNKVKIHHYDLYRLKSEEELVDLDLFGNTSNLITLIEWPHLIKKKPSNLIELIFNYNEDYEKRYLQVKGLIF